MTTATATEAAATAISAATDESRMRILNITRAYKTWAWYHPHATLAALAGQIEQAVDDSLYFDGEEVVADCVGDLPEALSEQAATYDLDRLAEETFETFTDVLNDDLAMVHDAIEVWGEDRPVDQIVAVGTRLKPFVAKDRRPDLTPELYRYLQVVPTPPNRPLAEVRAKLRRTRKRGVKPFDLVALGRDVDFLIGFYGGSAVLGDVNSAPGLGPKR